MKKCMAMLLVLVMSLGMVGCSKAELGYVEMINEVYEMDQSTSEQTVSITFDKEILAGTGMEFLGNYMELEMKSSSDLGKMAADITIGYRLNKTGDFQPLTRIVMVDDKLVMSTKDVFAAMVKYNDQLKWSPEFIKEMTAYLAANPYMDMDYAEAYKELGITDINAYMQESIKLSKSMFDMLVKNHEQYTTGLITESDGGYVVTMNQKNLIAMVDGWFTHAQKNPTAIYNLYKEMSKMMDGLSGTNSPLVSEVEFSTALGQVAAGWTSELKPELAKIAIDPKDAFVSHEKMTGEKGARVYTADSTFIVEEIGLNMTTKSTMKEGPVSITMPTKATDMITFMEGVVAIVDKHTTYNKTTIDLASKEATTNQTFGQNQFGSEKLVTITNVEYTNYMAVQDLNTVIADAQIIWDNGKKQVNVVKNGVTTPIAHITVDGHAYAKIADLTKAGYTVEVVKTPSLMIVITPGK